MRTKCIKNLLPCPFEDGCNAAQEFDANVIPRSAIQSILIPAIIKQINISWFNEKI